MDKLPVEIKEVLASVAQVLDSQHAKYEKFMDHFKEFVSMPVETDQQMHRTHQPNKKRAKKLNATSETEQNSEMTSSGADTSELTGLRPVRTTRLKTVNYKEPTLTTKLRQPTVKLERLSAEQLSSLSSKENKINLANKIVPTETENQKDVIKSSLQLSNTSVEIVVEVEPVNLEILSEDEMPPPAAVQPKNTDRKVKQKKQGKSTTENPIGSTKTTCPARSQASNISLLMPENIKKEAELSTSGAVTDSIYKDAAIELAEMAISTADKPIKAELPSAAVNETFVLTTAHIGHGDTTFVCPARVVATEANCNDTTFNSKQPPVAVGAISNNSVVAALKEPSPEKYAHNSLITDDESDGEKKSKASAMLPPPVKLADPSRVPKLIKASSKPQVERKELFSPCAESPVRKRVEAFEKHASDMASPFPQRMTRTKTRAKEKTAESNVKETVAKESVPQKATPVLETPRFFSQSLRKVVSALNGAAKLASASSGPIPKQAVSGKIRSRDPSVEKDKQNLLQALVDEKKKKREEKQRQAQQIREEKERERIELAEKAVRETEEKLRKLAKKKETQRKEIEQRVVNESRKQLQEQLSKQGDNKKELEDIQRCLNVMKKDGATKLGAMKQKPNWAKFTFEMLDSGDSTDDDTDSKPAKRPFPAWSQPPRREQLINAQATIPSKICDSFFSVQAMTPDLKEIFPEIDVQQLKRNSSAVWLTPQRYSQLPKY